MARKVKEDGDETHTDDVKAAVTRVLEHAESHGEVYEGATADHATIREALGIEDGDDDK